MIPNNQLTPLPWYDNLSKQNARRWWVYNRVYPLFVPAGYIPPFQFCADLRANPSIGNCHLMDANTNVVVTDIRQDLIDSGLVIKTIGTKYTVVVYPGLVPILSNVQNGRYYMRCVFHGVTMYSEVFTVVNDIEPYLKLEWWDREDFIMDAGAIVYTEPSYKNTLYLDATIAKPQYNFEEEGETRDGYFYPIKMISDKRFRFSFFASEYLLDALRFVRMSDYVQVTKNRQVYSVDTFLITPEWQNEGDVATVEAEFRCATVAKKIGVGYIKALRGDYNDDFNNDFDNE